MSKVICDHQHECKRQHKADHAKCCHAKPHRPSGAGCDGTIGGAKAICEDTRILSICVPVSEKGWYKTEDTEWCTCSCGHEHPIHKITRHKYTAKKKCQKKES